MTIAHNSAKDRRSVQTHVCAAQITRIVHREDNKTAVVVLAVNSFGTVLHGNVSI